MPADEPQIDNSLAHYMEERALAVALDKAAAPHELRTVQHLLEIRLLLMEDRAAFQADAISKRHARGEIYSKARVKAINAMGPSRSEMDRTVEALYRGESDSEHVLKAHARAHFGYFLISARLSLSSYPPDILEAARWMRSREDAFAIAWINSITDPAFKRELAEQQRDALRSSARPVYFVTEPASASTVEVDAVALGKTWSRLDTLAQELGVETLSSFLAVPGEGADAGIEANQLLLTVNALLDSLRQSGQKIPAKRATLSALSAVRETLTTLSAVGGKAYFEVDI
jgi:hypothetical protein